MSLNPYKYAMEIAELKCRMSAIEERIEKLEDTRKKFRDPDPAKIESRPPPSKQQL